MMKTIHIFILVILVAIFLSSITTIQAQTKEETKAWLNDNIKVKPTEYSEFKNLAMTYLDECGFEISGITKSSSTHLFVVPLNGMKINWNGELKF